MRNLLHAELGLEGVHALQHVHIAGLLLQAKCLQPLLQPALLQEFLAFLRLRQSRLKGPDQHAFIAIEALAMRVMVRWQHCTSRASIAVVGWAVAQSPVLLGCGAKVRAPARPHWPKKCFVLQQKPAK